MHTFINSMPLGHDSLDFSVAHKPTEFHQTVEANKPQITPSVSDQPATHIVTQQLDGPFWDVTIISTEFGQQCSEIITNLVYSIEGTSSSPDGPPASLPCPLCAHFSRLPFFTSVSPAPLMDAQTFRHFTNETFRVLQNGYRLRVSEAVQGISLFGKLVSAHFNHPFFALLQNNLHSLLLACVLIAHKLSTDHPIRNSCWAESFGVPLLLLNVCEYAVLNLAEWRPLCSQEDFNATLSMCCA
ncbi:hypothetical protein BLNAU_19085 [Blattamonas nauphoetae]|uniref:Cyclin N-terminal domain-containing protein n=1 Tax=Blattamonas nauphoetae TaxID=2049346 RepID=A0ABQ9X2L8_9EUKA|nr:hypothetical protein BLNAU_19085 [Blattamonas nauphoetae]